MLSNPDVWFKCWNPSSPKEESFPGPEPRMDEVGKLKSLLYRTPRQKCLRYEESHSKLPQIQATLQVIPDHFPPQELFHDEQDSYNVTIIPPNSVPHKVISF